MESAYREVTHSVRMVGHFHEKAGPCQAFFWSCHSYSRLPTNGRHSWPSSFLLRKVFVSAIDTADRRPTGGAQCCHPEFSNHRLALLPSALFVERLLRCQLGVLNWKRVLPSRTRTECLLPESRSSPTPQSPELGDLLPILSSCLLPFLP